VQTPVAAGTRGDAGIPDAAREDSPRPAAPVAGDEAAGEPAPAATAPEPAAPVSPPPAARAEPAAEPRRTDDGPLFRAVAPADEYIKRFADPAPAPAAEPPAAAPEPVHEDVTEASVSSADDDPPRRD
jgi:hypothetical protein